LALSVIKHGGNLVFQAGECLSRFMAGAVWLLHKCFSRLRIVKPYMSSPLSPERVIVAKDFRGSRDVAVDHLLRVAATMRRAREESQGRQDVLCFAPMDALLEPRFFLHLTLTSERFAQRETAAILALDFALRQFESPSLGEEEKAALLGDARREAAEMGEEGLHRLTLEQVLARPAASRPASELEATGSGSAHQSDCSTVHHGAPSDAPTAHHGARSGVRSDDDTVSPVSHASGTARKDHVDDGGLRGSSMRAASEGSTRRPSSEAAGRRKSSEREVRRPAAPPLVEFTNEAHPPQVDAPWKAVWSRSKAKWYFYNQETDTNSWVHPDGGGHA
jgi:hypothetical protein